MSGMYSREVYDGITEDRNKQSNQEDETSKKKNTNETGVQQNHSAIPRRYSGFKKIYKKIVWNNYKLS